LIEVWARRNPPNVAITLMADYGARKTLTYLNLILFVRLIRSTLFSKKQIHYQRQDNAHDYHGHNRDEHKAVFVLDANIAGQPARPTRTMRPVLQQHPINPFWS
jgi:hypothetical protein